MKPDIRQQFIARDLKVSPNTVRKVLRSGETSFEYEREVQPRQRLFNVPTVNLQLFYLTPLRQLRDRMTILADQSDGI